MQTAPLISLEANGVSATAHSVRLALATANLARRNRSPMREAFPAIREPPTVARRQQRTAAYLLNRMPVLLQETVAVDQPMAAKPMMMEALPAPMRATTAATKFAYRTKSVGTVSAWTLAVAMA